LEYKYKQLEDLGTVGYEGRNGWYVTGSKSTYFSDALDFWKSYLEPEKLKLLPTDAEMEYWVNLAKAENNGKHYCDDANTPLCNLTTGKWTPKHCENNPTCRTFVNTAANWVVGNGEAMIENLGLNLSLWWSGTGAVHDEILKNFSESQRPFLMYQYVPTTYVAQTAGMDRLALPNHDVKQWQGSEGVAGSISGIASDFTITSLRKLSSKRLKRFGPDAFVLLRKMTMTPEDVNYGLRLLPPLDSSAPTDYEQTACQWLKTTTTQWQRWLPLPWCPAGQVYSGETTHTCSVCQNPTHSPVAGMGLECIPCPEGKLTSADGVTCEFPPTGNEVLIDSTTLAIIAVVLVLVWIIMTAPVLYCLMQIDIATVYMERNAILFESVLDALELACGFLIIISFKSDSDSIQTILFVLVCASWVNIIGYSVYGCSLLRAAAETRSLLDFHSFVGFHTTCTLFVVLPELVLETLQYVDTNDLTDLIGVLGLAIDFGVRIKSSGLFLNTLAYARDLEQEKIAEKDPTPANPAPSTSESSGDLFAKDKEINELKRQLADSLRHRSTGASAIFNMCSTDSPADLYE